MPSLNSLSLLRGLLKSPVLRPSRALPQIYHPTDSQSMNAKPLANPTPLTAIMPKVKEVHLDGASLEGGGQLLRLALSLSCLTGKPLHITDIRGNRPKSRASKGRGGGLKKSHTGCVKFLATACNASTEGMVEGSDELHFWPNSVNQRARVEDAAQVDSERDNVTEMTIEQKTPGSIYLILQALLPYILFGPYSKQDNGSGEQRPVRLRITGGTNVSASPPHEYVTQVLFPMLTEHLGIPPIKTTLVKRGWSTQRDAHMGEVLFEITPMPKPLPAFRISSRGRLKKVKVYALSSPQDLGRAIADKVCERFKEGQSENKPGVETHVVLDEDSGKKNRVHVLVVAEFEGEDGKTLRVGRDCLLDGKASMRSEAVIETISKRLVRQIEEEINNGGAVDEYMQDQLVVFQALANGTSEVERQDPSLHTQTARWVAEKMLRNTSLEFDGGICEGIAFDPSMNGQLAGD